MLRRYLCIQNDGRLVHVSGLRIFAGLEFGFAVLNENENTGDRPEDAGSVALDRRPVDRAYDGIRRRILDGSLRASEHLGEEQLAELTATSRTPVREALRRLAGEGLVVVGANRRSYVAEFDPFEADAVFEIRARLEAFAAELAAQRFSDEGIVKLESISDQIEALGPRVYHDNLIRFLELNNVFHGVILDAARSRQLAIAVASAIAIPLPLLKHYVWDAPVDIARSNAQHRELIEAFRQRNPRWAGACMAAHINSTRPVEAAWRHARAEIRTGGEVNDRAGSVSSVDRMNR
jgi:DNA-binding GntR family transcriptional regulator